MHLSLVGGDSVRSTARLSISLWCDVFGYDRHDDARVLRTRPSESWKGIAIMSELSRPRFEDSASNSGSLFLFGITSIVSGKSGHGMNSGGRPLIGLEPHWTRGIAGWIKSLAWRKWRYAHFFSTGGFIKHKKMDRNSRILDDEHSIRIEFFTKEPQPSLLEAAWETKRISKATAEKLRSGFKLVTLIPIGSYKRAADQHLSCSKSLYTYLNMCLFHDPNFRMKSLLHPFLCSESFH